MEGHNSPGKMQEFLKLWGDHHRLTSVANPHGNCRAEVAVKTVQRMLMDNTGPTGSPKQEPPQPSSYLGGPSGIQSPFPWVILPPYHMEGDIGPQRESSNQTTCQGT